MLVDALRQSNSNQTQAARILGINRVTVWNRMKTYGNDLPYLFNNYIEGNVTGRTVVKIS